MHTKSSEFRYDALMQRFAVLSQVVVAFVGVAACSTAEAPSSAQVVGHAAGAVETPQWSDELARVHLLAPETDWELTPGKSSGGAAGVRIEAGAGCRGHVWRTRVSSEVERDRAAALEGRILDRVAASGVTDVTVRDKGEVPHGDFRALMTRLDGVLEAKPWFTRVTATFVTRPAGRFYVEIGASSGASSFVARRGCFDAITGSVTIQGERR